MSHRPGRSGVERWHRWLCPERLPESRGGARIEEEAETGRGPRWAGADTGLSTASVRRFRKREQQTPKTLEIQKWFEEMDGDGGWTRTQTAGSGVLDLPAE